MGRKRSESNVVDDNGRVVAKKCNSCGVVKDISSYNVLKRKGSQYLQSVCKECKRGIDRKYMKKKCSTDEYKEYYKSYRDKNKERLQEKQKLNHYYIKKTSCAIYVNNCIYCARPYTAHNKVTNFCSELCADRYRYYKTDDQSRKKKNRIYYHKYRNNNLIRTCIICGSEYNILDNGKIKYCSLQCRRIAKNKSRNESGKNHRSRAKYYGVIYTNIKREKVFSRDKWRCQLCGVSTPRKLMGKNLPNSPELDHIIPLSKGGPHTYTNTQCLCRSCNIDKSDKLLGQMLLAI